MAKQGREFTSPVAVVLTQQDKDRLSAVAREQGIPVSNLGRIILTKWLDERGGELVC